MLRHNEITCAMDDDFNRPCRSQYDEGRAAKRQGLGPRTNPYRSDSELQQYEAWLQGYQSI
jgi:hypothetical protein